jgi:rSAM/selenodomain-associated transferase 1
VAGGFETADCNRASAGASALVTHRRAVILLARAPSHPGKTRLTAHLPADRAAALRRALLVDTFEAIKRTRVPIVVAFSPDGGEEEMCELVGAPNVRFVPQFGADLGARMSHAIETALADGGQAVVLVGSDLPSLPPARITAAFDLLEHGADVVLGPSEDGGYYLIGMRRVVRELFTDIPWGAADVLARTRAAAERVRLKVALVEQWYDVDRPEDVQRVAASAEVARNTRAWLAWNTPA